MEDDRLRGKRGAARLLAVLGFGELVMLTAAALGTITLVYYLTRVLDGPAVLTPTPVVRAVATAPPGREARRERWPGRWWSAPGSSG